MLIYLKKIHIKSVKTNPLIDKLKEKIENSLCNCHSKKSYIVEELKINSH